MALRCPQVCEWVTFIGARPVTWPANGQCSERERRAGLERTASHWRKVLIASCSHLGREDYAKLARIVPHWISTETGIRIPVIQLTSAQKQQHVERRTFIYAHGHGDQMLPSETRRGVTSRLVKAASELSYRLDADVLVFEWPGWGLTQTADGTLMKGLWCGQHCDCVQRQQGSCSTSLPLVREAMAAILDFASRSRQLGGLGAPKRSVVLYGSSLGSALVTDFAASIGADDRVGAVVLVGAMTTIARTVCSDAAATSVCCFDDLRSIESAPLIKLPVLMLQVAVLLSLLLFISLPPLLPSLLLLPFSAAVSPALFCCLLCCCFVLPPLLRRHVQLTTEQGDEDDITTMDQATLLMDVMVAGMSLYCYPPCISFASLSAFVAASASAAAAASACAAAFSTSSASLPSPAYCALLLYAHSYCVLLCALFESLLASALTAA